MHVGRNGAGKPHPQASRVATLCPASSLASPSRNCSGRRGLPQPAGGLDVVVRRVEGALPAPARVDEQLGADGALRGRVRGQRQALDGADEGVVVGLHQEADGVPAPRAHFGLLRHDHALQLERERESK